MSADLVTVNDLRRAALLMNTKTRMPRLVGILAEYGAKKISDVPPDMRLACLLHIVSARSEREYLSWVVSQ